MERSDLSRRIDEIHARFEPGRFEGHGGKRSPEVVQRIAAAAGVCESVVRATKLMRNYFRLGKRFGNQGEAFN
jgi:hypothetical protein